MAIFLLIYLIIILAWVAWALALTMILKKYRYPDNIAGTVLWVFWGISVVIIILSVIFILKADWLSVPPLFQSLG